MDVTENRPSVTKSESTYIYDFSASKTTSLQNSNRPSLSPAPQTVTLASPKADNTPSDIVVVPSSDTDSISNNKTGDFKICLNFDVSTDNNTGASESHSQGDKSPNESSRAEAPKNNQFKRNHCTQKIVNQYLKDLEAKTSVFENFSNKRL